MRNLIPEFIPVILLHRSTQVSAEADLLDIAVIRNNSFIIVVVGGFTESFVLSVDIPHGIIIVELPTVLVCFFYTGTQTDIHSLNRFDIKSQVTTEVITAVTIADFVQQPVRIVESVTTREGFTCLALPRQ